MLQEQAASYQGLPLPVPLKFAICIIADIFDFTVGRLLLGVGTVGDVLGAVVLFILWGPKGLFAIWEAFDVTEQFDGFIPTNTIIATIANKR